MLAWSDPNSREEPLICFSMLTGGTMPVSAATGDGLYGFTVMTGIHNCSERATTALSDIFHGFFMNLGHPVFMK